MEAAVPLEDERRIRVLIAPIGNMSPEKFDKYCAMLKQFSEVPLSNFHLEIGEPNKCLGKRDFRKDKIYFEFITDEWAVQSDWEDMKVYRRILGVIGILDCAQWDQLTDASQEFTRMVSETSSVMSRTISRLCLAFEPSDDQADLQTDKLSGSTERFVMIPNQGLERTQFYLTTLFLDFATFIVKELENMIAGEPLLLLTPHDKFSQTIDSNKKQKIARFTKHQADMCLLAGSPLDAQEYYTSAVDLCKTHQDWLWVASSWEGIARSKLLQLKATRSGEEGPVLLPDTPEINIAFNEIVRLLEDAIDTYGRRTAPVLKIECLIKLARLYLLRGNSTAASSFIMKAYGESDGLSVQNKITLSSSIALIYKDIGMDRKFSFFLRETALLCKSISWNRRSHALFKLIAPHYHVQVASANTERMELTRRSTIFGNGREWLEIQSAVFDSLIEVAVEMQDPCEAIEYLIHYLSSLGPYLSPAKQTELASAITKQTSKFPVMKSLSTCGLLHISSIPSVNENNRGGKVVEKELPNARHARSGPFLYKPKRVSVAQQHEIPTVQVTANTAVTLRLDIVNPYHFPLTLQHIELKHSSIKIRSHPILQVVLPAEEKSSMDITIVPLETGTIDDVTLYYRCFNCLLHQTIKLDMHLQVIQSLSVLSVTCPSLNGSAISLYDGQFYHLNLIFENIGCQEIDFINMQIKETTQGPDDAISLAKRAKAIFWDKELVGKHVPMAPGKSSSFCMPITIKAQKYCTGARIVIKYGKMSDIKDAQRSLEVPFSFHFVGGLEAVNFDILECTKESLTRFSDFPPHSDFLLDPSKNEKAYCLALFEVKNLSNQPFYLHVDDESKKEGKEEEGKGTFEDRSEFFSAKSFLTIEAASVKRVVVALERMSHKPEDLPVIEPALRKYLIKEKNFTPKEFELYLECEYYKQRLLEHISARWRSITRNCSGMLWLNNCLQLDTVQLSRLKCTSVMIELTPQVALPDSSRQFTVPNNTLVAFKLRVTNNTNRDDEYPLGPLQLSLVPLVMNSLSLSWVGKIGNVTVEKLLPQSSSEHLFTLCFHEKGHYNLLGACKEMDSDLQHHWSDKLTVVVT